MNQNMYLETLTAVHRSHHTSDESINAPAFLHEWNEGRNTTFIVSRISEMGEHHLLE